MKSVVRGSQVSGLANLSDAIAVRVVGWFGLSEFSIENMNKLYYKLLELFGCNKEDKICYLKNSFNAFILRRLTNAVASTTTTTCDTVATSTSTMNCECGGIDFYDDFRIPRLWRYRLLRRLANAAALTPTTTCECRHCGGIDRKGFSSS
ncbi:hypothetical protein AVEN_115648-1 [Araneus ventricosus]|uniref:Uncharacterized protein n=1 Tax=Araneus ventricosus TaxID=182803 RepID=A0A4Y2KZZ5_ARAVE|nr:hypothetical protein AVEN_115648-1 [Araneus ventricosus]